MSDMIDELTYLERENLKVILKKAKLTGEVLVRIADVNGELEYAFLGGDITVISRQEAEKVLRQALTNKFGSIEHVLRGMGFE